MRTAYVVALCALALARPCAAQDAKPAAGDRNKSKAPATNTITPPAYQLGADDTINIQVIGHQQLSVQLVVPPDGNITVPLLDPIDVTGKTTQELAALLADKWRKYIVNPSVTVSLTAKRRDSILVYGFVGRVGPIEYRPDLKLVELIAEAGGAAPNGDLSQLSITRKSGTKLVIDLSRPETRGNTDADIPMAVGDVVYVPERRTQISVLGEVNRAGSYEYRDDMTVLDALMLAGGAKDTADRSAATLTHSGKESKLDLEALLNKGDMSQNVKLAAGDRIMVPEIQNRTYIFGAVGRPGYYPFKPGDRVLDALNAAGPGRDADLAKVNHIRVDKKTNTAVVQAVNVDKLLRKGNLAANIPLAPGDVLYIPEKRRSGFGIQDLFGALSGLSIIDNATRILTHGIGSGYRY